MKRIWMTVCVWWLAMSAQALTIPQGTLYFDNSRTNYGEVYFVYGSDYRLETYALRMEPDGDKWRVEITEPAADMYRYTFVGGALGEGLYRQDFGAFKDSVTHQLGLNRTATTDEPMQAGEIFVPTSGDNWAQGEWMSLTEWEADRSSTGGITGTLPVVYVETENHRTITDTETQVPATVYIDSMLPEYRSLGTAEMPIAATIKGRGNWTWSGFDKKPYKLKFDTKQKVLGMPNNRHWCLMACADDYIGFLKMPAGFRISEAVGLRWTPRMCAVELVLNGRYMGLYFLTEHVRIAANRVNIVEQEEGETDSRALTGGWLVEIDNYSSANNITFSEGNGQHVMVSLKEPETLSAAQRDYIENQLFALNDALYDEGSDLAERLDMQEAARYYLVQEIMEDCESYHGSCFLYKDRDSLGVKDKWKFGPVWDFGNAYNRMQDQWIYENPSFEQYWIGQLAAWPAFQQAVGEQWWLYYHHEKDRVRSDMEAFAEHIRRAAKSDAKVWKGTQGYCDNSDMTSRLNDYLWRYDWRIGWLYSQWGEGIKPGTEALDGCYGNGQVAAGRMILRDGSLYIERDGRVYTLQGQLVK